MQADHAQEADQVACAWLVAAGLGVSHLLGEELAWAHPGPGRLPALPAAIGGLLAFGLAGVAAMLPMLPAKIRYWGLVGVACALFLLPIGVIMRHQPEHQRYTTDAIAYCHDAALRLNEGRNPYAEPTWPAAQERLGIEPWYVTRLRDGSPDTRFPYPAGSFLICWPFVTLGLIDLRWLSAGCLLLVAALLAHGARGIAAVAPWMLLAGYPLLARMTYGSVTDPWWLVPAVWAWRILPRLPLGSALLMGVGAAVKQQVWLMAPFAVVACWRLHGAGRAALGSALAVGVFFAINAPWIVLDGKIWLDGVGSVFLRDLELSGHGLVALDRAGVLTFSPRLLTVLGLGAWGVAFVAYSVLPQRVLGLGPALALLPVVFSTRSHANHTYLLPLLLLAWRPLPALQCTAAAQAGTVAAHTTEHELPEDIRDDVGTRAADFEAR
jgi:hypothetical protein